MEGGVGRKGEREGGRRGEKEERRKEKRISSCEKKCTI